MAERRRKDRKDFSYYMRLTNVDTGELVGHLVDISTAGFKLDSQKPLPVDKEFRFHLDLTSEVASKPFMVFKARSKWCQTDPFDPFVYNVGFELVEIAPSDLDIFKRIVEEYGTTSVDKRKNLRNPNRW
jgi:hypothetical protein